MQCVKKLITHLPSRQREEIAELYVHNFATNCCHLFRHRVVQELCHYPESITILKPHFISHVVALATHQTGQYALQTFLKECHTAAISIETKINFEDLIVNTSESTILCHYVEFEHTEEEIVHKLVALGIQHFSNLVNANKQQHFLCALVKFSVQRITLDISLEYISLLKGLIDNANNDSHTFNLICLLANAFLVQITPKLVQCKPLCEVFKSILLLIGDNWTGAALCKFKSKLLRSLVAHGTVQLKAMLAATNSACIVRYNQLLSAESINKCLVSPIGSPVLQMLLEYSCVLDTNETMVEAQQAITDTVNNGNVVDMATSTVQSYTLQAVLKYATITESVRVRDKLVRSLLESPVLLKVITNTNKAGSRSVQCALNLCNDADLLNGLCAKFTSLPLKPTTTMQGDVSSLKELATDCKRFLLHCQTYPEIVQHGKTM